MLKFIDTSNKNAYNPCMAPFTIEGKIKQRSVRNEKL